jgi:hypothetical protein
MSVDIARDPGVPAAVWSRLTPEDKSEYLRLKLQFYQAHRTTGKEGRISVFHRELQIAYSYITSRTDGREERSIVCGIGFAGEFICVNTRQLKAFLSRCKSSINGSFLQMGYVAVITKLKARKCLLSVLHSLIDDSSNFRQWGVRAVSNRATFCMASALSASEKPAIGERDLIPQKQPAQVFDIGFLIQRSFVKPFQQFSSFEEDDGQMLLRDDDLLSGLEARRLEPVVGDAWTDKFADDFLFSVTAFE